MENTDNTNKQEERGPEMNASEGKKRSHMVFELPFSKKGSEAEGRTPIVIHGDGNTINIIERQYNEKSAAETVKALLAGNQAELENTKQQMEVIKSIITEASNITSMFIKPKMQSPAPAPQPGPVNEQPKAEPKAETKTLSADEKRELRNAKQRARRAKAKKVAKAAPAKKAAKKSTRSKK